MNDDEQIIIDLIYNDFSWVNSIRLWDDIRLTIKKEVNFKLEHEIYIMLDQYNIEQRMKEIL